MSVRRDGEVAWLEGVCRVEEAEVLAGLLSAGVSAVDLSACEAMHGTVAQVLLAWGPALRGEPRDAFLRDHLLPALAGGASVATSADGDGKEHFPSGIGSEGAEGAPI